MAVGGCFCGKVRVELRGQPIKSGLCHCTDCRKLTGSPYSYSFVVKTAELQVTGSPKTVPKTADSGNHVQNYFCPDCGTPLYGQRTRSHGVPDEMTIVRAGIFDDVEILNQHKPDAELFTTRRMAWLTPVHGAAQLTGMMESIMIP